jgi:hypothetical protein
MAFEREWAEMIRLRCVDKGQPKMLNYTTSRFLKTRRAKTMRVLPFSQPTYGWENSYAGHARRPHLIAIAKRTATSMYYSIGCGKLVWARYPAWSSLMMWGSSLAGLLLGKVASLDTQKWLRFTGGMGSQAVWIHRWFGFTGGLDSQVVWIHSG